MRKTFLALVLAALVCSVPFRVLAGPESAAHADPKAEAQALATQALDYLRRGEDATSNDEKRVLYGKGLELAQRSLTLDDTNPDAHFAVFGNRGRLLLLGGVGAAVGLMTVNSELERALQLNPNHPDALTAKGGLYRQLPWVLGGNLQVAETCLTRAIQLDPDAVSARIELAATYRDMGHPERGVDLLLTAEQIAQREGKYRQLSEARSLMQQLQRP